ncbi:MULTISPECIES: hypothetical protein [unclassified Acinetobacter]|uniref:hypothetical protein n=1 Tax=unclassified Acinetobacter TaxID=196816 RepID=UPI001212A733|nr:MULTISPECIES: hypothetical protein [unclassified Acinetobacter]RZJ22133.1 MAG: hypothetical protein EON51_08655 [Acinetobacter sp.]
MSNLVTIFSKFYDKSGQRIINLNVKSRYQGSTRENQQKTDEKGVFTFQASSNRTIEILAKPPNAKEYTVFKMMNSSVNSSASNPIKVYLPKTIEEYRKENIKIPQSKTVKNYFKVVDSNGKVMSNFPIQSRPKGKKSFERCTNQEGLAEIESSPNRDIEILVLTSNDTFVLKKSVNSGNGSKQPILIQLDEPYNNFKSLSTITLLDRNDNKYNIAKTNVEILVLESKDKNLISVSNGKLAVRGYIGKWLKITVYKPDGTPLKSVNYLPKRIKESSVKLHLDVDVTNGSTQQDKPNINKNIENKPCPKECIIETVTFNTEPGPYIISMLTWKKILEFETYEAKPYQPGDNSSGVTIAIGYDLGQQTKAQIQKDLASFYSAEQINRLLTAQGKIGAVARELIPKLSDITITKDKALRLATVLKTRYANQVLSIYPEALNLHPHCQGVLLSLVFNRGPGLKDKKGQLTRKHMRQIKEAFKNNEIDTIPNIFRDMSKLWNKTGKNGNRGVGIRRRQEAAIFEEGLKCDCFQ